MVIPDLTEFPFLRPKLLKNSKFNAAVAFGISIASALHELDQEEK
jgi:hypothetical protein